MDAYDVATGKRAWRFYTIPHAGRTRRGNVGLPGSRESVVPAGLPAPTTRNENLILLGHWQPGPDMNGDVRPGDNLYTCSLVALDADTGKLKWHFQFTPHDVHDWDAIGDPVLVDLNLNGATRKAVVQANRNGHYYALDRTNGKLLFVNLTPSSELDQGVQPAAAHPVLLPDRTPAKKVPRPAPV